MTEYYIENTWGFFNLFFFVRRGCVAAVQFCQQCNDGIERVYSHGGDVLNDDYSHDAFDCYRLLECDGVW